MSAASSSSSPSSASINALLKKTEHYDKDERYMATSDLCEVLKRHASGDSNTTNNHHHPATVSSSSRTLFDSNT
jgi:cullin-associated NEDD8-dissociated protein 1